MNKKGQGSFLSGDIPSIILIVVSITFFISSMFMAISQFEGAKAKLSMEAALVDAASTFLKENAMIDPDNMGVSGFWASTNDKIKQSFGVEVYVEVVSLDPASPRCLASSPCTVGSPPSNPREVLTKRFPVALESGDTELEVYPALAKVSVYKG